MIIKSAKLHQNWLYTCKYLMCADTYPIEY